MIGFLVGTAIGIFAGASAVIVWALAAGKKERDESDSEISGKQIKEGKRGNQTPVAAENGKGQDE